MVAALGTTCRAQLINNNLLGVYPDPGDIFNSADLKLWINTSNTANKTLTGRWNEQISSLTSDDANGYSFTATADNEMAQNINGKGLYLRGISFLQQTSTSNFKLLHDGSSWTFSFAFCPMVSAATSGGIGASYYPLFVNNAVTTAQTGIAIIYDNTTAGGRTQAISVVITKSSAGNSVFNLPIDNFFTVGIWTNVRIECSGTNITVYKNGVIAGTQARLNTPNTGNATGNFFIGRQSNAAVFAQACMIKHPIIVSRTLTAAERVNLDNFYLSESTTFGTGAPANVYLMFGQSNMVGQGTTADPSTPLKAAMTAYVFTNTKNGGQVLGSQEFDRILWNTNPVNTIFGPTLKCAYLMDQRTPDFNFYIEYADGATALVDGLTDPDWNIASTATTNCAPRSRLAIRYGLLYLKYALDRNVTIRGWGWRQGETDAAAGTDNGAQYKIDLENLICYHIDEIYNLGFTSDKCRFVMSLVNQTYTPPRAFMNSISNAIIAVTTDFTTDKPAYAGKIKALDYFDFSGTTPGTDGVHFFSSGIEAMSDAFDAKWSAYINE